MPLIEEEEKQPSEPRDFSMNLDFRMKMSLDSEVCQLGLKTSEDEEEKPECSQIISLAKKKNPIE